MSEFSTSRGNFKRRLCNSGVTHQHIAMTRHHHIPSSMLALFGQQHGIATKLWIHDKQRKGQPRHVSVKDAAVRVDYYTVDSDSLPPDYVEDLFGKIETNSLLIINDIGSSLTVPRADKMQELIYFLSLLFARGPAVRDYWAKQLSKIPVMMAKLTAHQTSKQLQALFEDAGMELEGVDPAELNDIMAGDDYVVSTTREYRVSMILEQVTRLYQLLFERRWYILFRSPKMSNTSVIGDCPVILAATHAADGTFSPGFKERSE